MVMSDFDNSTEKSDIPQVLKRCDILQDAFAYVR